MNRRRRTATIKHGPDLLERLPSQVCQRGRFDADEILGRRRRVETVVQANERYSQDVTMSACNGC